MYNVPLTDGSLYIIVLTYDGSRVNAGCKIYLNGVRVDNADAGWGTYTAMENLTGIVEAFCFAGGNRVDGRVGLWTIIQKELSANEVWAITQRVKGLLGL